MVYVERDPDAYYRFEFETTIEPHDVGRYAYSGVFLPDAFRRHLPLAEHSRLRISGEIGEQPFEGAWQPYRGRSYITISNKLLKEENFEIGDGVVVRFRGEEGPEIVFRGSDGRASFALPPLQEYALQDPFK